MKRLNIHIPEELHTRLKVAVALEKTGISGIIRKFLEQYVEKIEKKHSK